MKQNHFEAGSGFTLRYTFYADGDFKDHAVALVAERPEFYRISINGNPVAWNTDCAPWLDLHNGAADIGPHIRKDKNIIELTAERFDILLEPEAVYLRGDFGVEIQEEKWTIIPPATLALGEIGKQGLPFYTGALHYTFDFMGKEGIKTLLEIKDFDASSLQVSVNGSFCGIYGVDGRKAMDISSFVVSGKNQVVLRLSTGLRNLLGPHHVEVSQRKIHRNTAFPHLWDMSPKVGTPDASGYDILPYGIYSHPIILTEKD